MSAKEMFERLGYELEPEETYAGDKILPYRCYKKNMGITFYLKEKQFVKTKRATDCIAIKESELKAIIQQCKELGWLEDEKQETNYEHYKDEIIENCGFTFALVGGKPHKCACVNCNDCGFSTGHGCTEKIKEWLKKPHEKPVSVYKLTKFEKELLQCYPDIYSFKVFNSLNGMKEKGYFKGIDENEIIGDILTNCEVREDENC